MERTRSVPCFSLLLMAASRDRIAPNCTIRHLVWPIVALQRRVGFSARLTGFCRGRCHQRRARRAQRASFSVFVSNPDFRVPRLRQRGGVGRRQGRAASEKRPHEGSTDRALEAHFTHQTGHRASSHVAAPTAKLTPDLAHAIHVKVLLPYTTNLAAELDVALRSRWLAAWVRIPGHRERRFQPKVNIHSKAS